MIFIIHYSVHFLATPPSKISTGTKKQNAAYNDETYAVWRMETVYDLPSKKICVQLLENGWHLSSLEKPVGIHLKKEATLRDIYPFWFIFILVKSQSLWVKFPFLLILCENGMPPK